MSRKHNLQAQRTKFLIPKNDKQKLYIQLIREKTIVFAIGPSGTAKTRTACSIALEELYNGNFDKIILTRPVLECGSSMGFLPGDLSEKIQPYMVPLFVEFQESIEQKELEQLIKDKKIEIVPFNFMRGRNFKRCIVIADESQGCTDEQLKTLITRLSIDCKILINGDLSQSDLHKNLQGALERMINKLCDGSITEIGLIQFTRDDIVRHPLISRILDKLEGYNIIEHPLTDTWKQYYDPDAKED